MQNTVYENIKKYLLTGEKVDFDWTLDMIKEDSLVLDKIVKELVSNINKKLELMEVDSLEPTEASLLIFDITIMLDSFNDVVYSLINRKFLFDKEFVEKIKKYFDDFCVRNRIVSFSKKYNVPITLALPCDYVGKEKEMLFIARRGEASIVLDKVFNDLLEFESPNWEELIFGLYYEPTDSEWNKVLGGVDQDGNIVPPSLYMIAIAELLESHGYKLPHVVDGKVVY